MTSEKRTWRRWVGVVSAVYLVGVPAMFTLWPSWTRASVVIRLVVTVVWLAAAIVLALVAAARDERIDGMSKTRTQEIRHVRLLAFSRILAELCRSGAFGLPESYEMTVYLPEEGDVLVPVYPPWDTKQHGPDPRIFAAGKGATGTAWQRDGLVLVTGDPVADGHYELTPEQQGHFRDLKTAVSTVIIDAHDRRVGVLTLVSKDEDGAFSEGSPNQAVLRELASVIGVVITDVFPKTVG